MKNNSHNWKQTRQSITFYGLVKLCAFKHLGIGGKLEHNGRIFGLADCVTDMRGVDTFWQFDETDSEYLKGMRN